MIKPSHYLKEWHIKYGDIDKIKAKADELSLEFASEKDWINVFNQMEITNWEIPNRLAKEYPSVHPFIVTRTDDTTVE